MVKVEYEGTSVQAVGGADGDTDIDIVIDANNNLHLKEQPAIVRRLLKVGTKAVLVKIVLENAYPEYGTQNLWIREILINGADELGHSGLRHRLTEDDHYAYTLAKIVSLCFYINLTS
jgi:hypothetical protein